MGRDRRALRQPGVQHHNGDLFRWSEMRPKARRFGFHEHVDTEAMFLALFRELRRRRVIPELKED